jgi:hypothetical protein
MSTNAVATINPGQSPRPVDMNSLEALILYGDLGKLSPQQRVEFVGKLCELTGLNPLTKPFEFMTLQGKVVCYAGKNCAEQLRKVHSVSLRIAAREQIGDVYVVTAEASLPNGRVDSATGAVPLAGLKGDALANAMMKAETKAKRRVTLSICSLGMLDEMEVDSIPPSQRGAVSGGQSDIVGNGAMVPAGGGYVIPKGTWARRRVAEVPEADLRKDVEMREAKASLEEWEIEFLDRAKFHLETLAQIEPENEAPSKPVCSCGSGLVKSRSKPVYYCPKFKEPGEHSRAVPAEQYEAGA